MSLTDFLILWCAVSCLTAPALGLFIEAGRHGHAR